VLDEVSWDFYERLLEEVGDRTIRVTFFKGNLEIMAPLAEHEWAKKIIGQLIEAMTLELGIFRRAYGSTTFRREDLQAGLEPDECYYFRNEEAVRGMKRFDPAVHPAPDLAVEIDITSRSIAREPIYAALGVRELWRYDGERLVVLVLQQNRRYLAVASSPTFPFLPMDQFAAFIPRMDLEQQTLVLREFCAWLRTLEK
jgi:Uma2 family endonuclease